MTVIKTILETVELTVINCGKCAGTYSINERYRAKQQEVGGTWTCPYCQCSWGYSNNNENARLKRELESKQRELEQERKRKEWAEHAARKESSRANEWQRKEQAQRAAKTRIKNRVSHGVCPCCNRNFQNLARHMSGQHPDYAKDTK